MYQVSNLRGNEVIKMDILAAPIIHARNVKHDFPSRLLVIPDDFLDSDIQWARSYILDSTACMELSGQEGRRVVFCNNKVVVTGISVFIFKTFFLLPFLNEADTIIIISTQLILLMNWLASFLLYMQL